MALLAACLCGCNGKAPAPPKAAGDTAVPVTVAKVQRVPWDRAIPIVGTLYPKDEATASAEVEGTVQQTLVDFGDRVREGQLLGQIDTAAYSARRQQSAGVLAKAQANLANAEQNLRRVQELNRNGIASSSDLDQATALAAQWRAEVKAAEGSHAVAELDFARSEVKAPFNGAIAQRIVSQGDFVKVGSPLFQVVNDAVLKFIFQVPERYGSLVAKGLPVAFSVDNYPGEGFQGQVYLISPAVEVDTRAFNVGALVTNAQQRLKARTFARGQLVIERAAPTLTVPLEAVVSFAGVTKLFVVEQGVARGRTVQVGRIQAGRQEILTGVEEGVEVVVTGQSKLQDGTKVALRSPAKG
jgi:membrane fusion protein (multidrug efflux system)